MFIAICDPPCQNNGDCIAVNTCNCSATGFSGSLCAIRTIDSRVKIDNSDILKHYVSLPVLMGVPVCHPIIAPVLADIYRLTVQAPRVAQPEVLVLPELQVLREPQEPQLSLEIPTTRERIFRPQEEYAFFKIFHVRPRKDFR